MKKTAIALALAGVIAAPTAFADTTVYGSVRISEDYRDEDGAGDNEFDVTDQSSRLGFKGSEDLGNGLSAIYRYEFRVQAADGPLLGSAGAQRLAYAGLKGGFGQLTIGTQWNPFYFAVAGEVDLFNSGVAALGYYDNGGFTRSNNLVVYSTPSLNGLTGYVAAETDADGSGENVDRYQVAGIYDNGALFLGAGYRQSDKNFLGGTDDQNQWGVQARYIHDLSATDALIIAGLYFQDDKGTDNDTGSWEVLGEYKFGANRAMLSYHQVNESDDGDDDGLDGWAVGLRHDFSNRTRVWLEYGDQETDDNSAGGSLGPEGGQLVSVGVRHDF